MRGRLLAAFQRSHVQAHIGADNCTNAHDRRPDHGHPHQSQVPRWPLRSHRVQPLPTRAVHLLHIRRGKRVPGVWRGRHDEYANARGCHGMYALLRRAGRCRSLTDDGLRHVRCWPIQRVHMASEGPLAPGAARAAVRRERRFPHAVCRAGEQQHDDGQRTADVYLGSTAARGDDRGQAQRAASRRAVWALQRRAVLRRERLCSLHLV